MNTEENQLTDHSYDGIQEYDNPLPGWWKFLFVFFIIFGFFYYMYFDTGVKGRSIHDEYILQVSRLMEQRFAKIGALQPNDETILKYLDDPEWLKVGEVVYKANCTGCHGANGQGVTGPNLTDDNWKNVRTLKDIASVISDGAKGGAMPAWKNRLGHINKIVLTASYVASLRSTNPADGKPPEGSVIPPWK